MLFKKKQYSQRENRMMVARDWGGQGNRELLMGIEF